MPQIHQKRQKSRNKKPPVQLATYTPAAIRGPSWYSDEECGRGEDGGRAGRSSLDDPRAAGAINTELKTVPSGFKNTASPGFPERHRVKPGCLKLPVVAWDNAVKTCENQA